MKVAELARGLGPEYRVTAIQRSRTVAVERWIDGAWVLVDMRDLP